MIHSQIRINFTEINLSSEMSNITTPALIIWGIHDGMIPPALADDAYDSIGTPVTDKRKIICSNSGHHPYVEDQDIFCSEVRSFIEQYK